jgi:hypothetical protein
MEKRSDNVDKSERVETSDEKWGYKKKESKPKAPETIRLIMLRNLKLNYTGPVTGKLYVFNGGGSVLDVDERDAQIMMAKRGGDCCPSGSGPQPYFAIEEG